MNYTWLEYLNNINTRHNRTISFISFNRGNRSLEIGSVSSFPTTDPEKSSNSSICERCSHDVEDNPCAWIFCRKPCNCASVAHRSPRADASSESPSTCNVCRTCDTWMADRSSRDSVPFWILKQVAQRPTVRSLISSTAFFKLLRSVIYRLIRIDHFEINTTDWFWWKRQLVKKSTFKCRR